MKNSESNVKSAIDNWLKNNEVTKLPSETARGVGPIGTNLANGWSKSLGAQSLNKQNYVHNKKEKKVDEKNPKLKARRKRIAVAKTKPTQKQKAMILFHKLCEPSQFNQLSKKQAHTLIANFLKTKTTFKAK